MPHSVRAVGGVWLTHVGWATYDELDLIVESLDDVLSNIQDQVDSLLARNTADEGEKWDAVIKFPEVEVLLLELLFSGEMVWGNGVQLSGSLGNWDTIGEGEGLGLLTQKPAEGGPIEEIISVGFTDGGPLVTQHDGAPTWVDHGVSPSWVDEPVSWQLVESLKSSMFWIEVDSSLVSLL